MPPFAQIRLHDNAGGGGVRQNLSCVLRKQAAFLQEVVGVLGVLHAVQPEVRGFVFLLVEQRTDEGDLVGEVYIPLAFDAEAGETVAGQLCHDVAGSDKLHGHVSKFQRRVMAALDERSDKARGAGIGDLVMGLVAVAASVFDAAQGVHAVCGILYHDGLIDDFHLLFLLIGVDSGCDGLCAQRAADQAAVLQEQQALGGMAAGHVEEGAFILRRLLQALCVCRGWREDAFDQVGADHVAVADVDDVWGHGENNSFQRMETCPAKCLTGLAIYNTDF